MKDKNITTLDQLKDWNKNPTVEKPIVLEWFLDWFFEELLDKGKENEAIEARNVMIEFTEKCENMTKTEAIERVDRNFDYYSGYSITRWVPQWDKLKKRIMEIDIAP